MVISAVLNKRYVRNEIKNGEEVYNKFFVVNMTFLLCHSFTAFNHLC